MKPTVLVKHSRAVMYSDLYQKNKVITPTFKVHVFLSKCVFSLEEKETLLSRVVTRHVGSGIRRVESEITTLGSGIIDHGIGISSFVKDQRSGCTIFVGSGTKIGHAFGIKDHKFAYKNVISDEKTYLVTILF